MFKTTLADPAYVRMLAFLSSAFLCLIIYGAGLGAYGASLPDMVKSGRITSLAAWGSVAIGGLSFLIAAIFMAHHMILLCCAMVRGDRRDALDRAWNLLNDCEKPCKICDFRDPLQ